MDADLERIKDILAQVCAVARGDVRDDGLLLSYGLDSIRAVDFVLHIEEAFDIEVSESEATQFATVADVADYVREWRRSEPAWPPGMNA